MRRVATPWLAAAVVLAAVSLGQLGTASAVNLTRSDLGARVCAPHAPPCRELWNARVAAGDSLRTLVAAVCLYLRYEVDELDGIVCLETIIHSARALQPDMLLDVTYPSAVDSRDESRRTAPDPQWTDSVASYLEAIPVYCDRTTPVIYEYFDCVLRELLNVRFALRHRVRAECSIGSARLRTTSAGCASPGVKRSAYGKGGPAAPRLARRA